MPQPRSRRKAEPDQEEPEAPEEEVAEDDVDEGDPGGVTLNIDVADDRVIIELPRDGNERPALEAIGAMLESMR
jgi:hypothetical protein